MKHLTRHEISRLVGIKYKGSQNQNDLDFLNVAMEHILICPTCLKQFKEKTNMLVNGLNFELEKRTSLKELCVGIIDNGLILVKDLDNQFHCFSEDMKNILFPKEFTFSLTRSMFHKIPDYIIEYNNNEVVVVTFEDFELYMKQDDKIIQYSSKVKNEITYEYCYVFKDVEINKEFYLMIDMKSKK